MVWRRLRIAADTSLAALHFIFQIVQGWGDDHLHQFHIYGKDYGISYEGGIGFVDNPFRVVIDDFAFDAGDRFTYEYNFFEHWLQGSAWKTESMVTPVFATPILTTSWLA